MTDTTLSPQPEIAGRSLAQLAMMRFRRNKAAITGCVLLVFITLFSLWFPARYSDTVTSMPMPLSSWNPACGPSVTPSPRSTRRPRCWTWCVPASG